MTSEPPRRVLVVDDHPDVVEVLSVMLESLGHEVRGLTSFEQVLECISTFDPSIILLDVQLGTYSGVELAREVRRAPGGATRMIVAISGWDPPDQVAPFDRYLVKPVTRGVIRELTTELERSIRHGHR